MPADYHRMAAQLSPLMPRERLNATTRGTIQARSSFLRIFFRSAARPTR